MDSNETVVISRADFISAMCGAGADTETAYDSWSSLMEAEKSRTTPDDQPLDQGGSSVDSNNSALSRRSERFYQLWQEVDREIDDCQRRHDFEGYLHWSNLSEACRNVYEILQHQEICAASVKATKPSG